MEHSYSDILLHVYWCKAKEWLQNMGIGDQTAVVHDDDEPEDGAVPIYTEDSSKHT